MGNQCEFTYRASCVRLLYTYMRRTRHRRLKHQRIGRMEMPSNQPCDVLFCCYCWQTFRQARDTQRKPIPPYLRITILKLRRKNIDMYTTFISTYRFVSVCFYICMYFYLKIFNFFFHFFSFCFVNIIKIKFWSNKTNERY